MKLLADYLPILIFFIVYKIKDIYAATAVAIVASFLLLVGQYIWYRRVETMTLVSAALVAVFGGATIYLHSEIFIKIKPSILYALFAAAFLVAQIRGTLIVEQLLGKQLGTELPKVLWRQLNNYWIAFFLFLALLNLYIAFSFSTDIWVDFKLFGLFGITVIFMIFQGILISRAAHNGDKDADKAMAAERSDQGEP